VRAEECAYYVNNFAKTLVRKQEYGVKLWRHKQRTPNTNNHHLPLTEKPLWNFSAHATQADAPTIMPRADLILFKALFLFTAVDASSFQPAFCRGRTNNLQGNKSCYPSSS